MLCQVLDTPERIELEDHCPHFPFGNPTRVHSKEMLHVQITFSTINKIISFNFTIPTSTYHLSNITHGPWPELVRRFTSLGTYCKNWNSVKTPLISNVNLPQVMFYNLKSVKLMANPSIKEAFSTLLHYISSYVREPVGVTHNNFEQGTADKLQRG